MILKKQKKLVDVLIKPETEGFSIFGFENVDSLIQRGYEAALPYKDYFRKLADSLNRIGPQKPIENILDKQTYTFNKIEIRVIKAIQMNRYLVCLTSNLEKKLINICLPKELNFCMEKHGLIK